MKFERLRLSGFKTFVDPVEISIAPGLTGIVGPNGCGKSNLVEALRWAMGETSSKSLRGAGMEDVIFAGSTSRPERSHAEVSLRLAEPPADLPGHLAGAEAIEISRKIVREQGSTYRMNGREVRARDVQILFADAASGARSPSLVRQGQIAELIAAKPQHRRRILEDAAGVAGLHTRRHEAELRLKGAEDNLARLADILGAYERQRGELKKQARAAERFRVLGAQIRALEISLLAAGFAEAKTQAGEAKAAHDAAIRAEGMAMAAQGEAERARAVAEHEAEAARSLSAEAQARQNTLTGERAALDAELAHLHARLSELAQRRVEAARDAEAAGRTQQEAAEAMRRLAAEQATLAASLAGQANQNAALAARTAQTQAARQAAENAVSSHVQRLAQANAARHLAEQQAREAAQQASRLAAQAEALAREIAAMAATGGDLAHLPALEAAVAAADATLEQAAAAHEAAERDLTMARRGEQAARPRLAEAERLAQRLETEVRTIRKLVDNTEPGLWTPAVDRITVAPGLEPALAAALGDDLQAAIEPGAPRHWSEVAQDDLPALPPTAEPLLAHVEAPGALHARLSQIGLVTRETGDELSAHLRPGQRLVSREGDLWRWDGFSSRAGAENPAARRLAERNRLADLDRAVQAARIKRDDARLVLDGALKALRMAEIDEARQRNAHRSAQNTRETAARTLAAGQSASENARIRLETLHARLETTQAEATGAAAREQASAAALAALPPESPEDEALLAARLALEIARAAENEAHMALSRHEGEAGAASQRLLSLSRDLAAWEGRAARARATSAELAERAGRLAREEAELSDRPDVLAATRLTLCDSIEQATGAARAAGDSLALAQASLRVANEAARATLAALAEAKAATARQEERREAAAQRLAALTQAIEARIGAPVSDLPAPDGAQDTTALEIQLGDLKAERDRLGAVNLRAEIELCEIEKEHTRLTQEREDVEKAILRLRRAIDQLNAEGRRRLRAAFEQVNAAFTRLFTRLFGGGTAQLQLVEADDPLDAGLEILAHPPGKKPQLLSLLSGGEQALTATALIFAVFLTNPAPICVLDEVDAPLDDSNVERLCDLLADMARETATRFLVITHNPISMARMDRLYGVTMVERGVSQVVSVDLVTAESLAEAG